MATKASHFLGIARISLDDLDFSDALNETHRDKSLTATSRLLNVFKLDGCRRWEEENFIDAVIDAETFRFALQTCNMSPSVFKSKALEFICNPDQIIALTLHRPISCLNGLHRKCAAEMYLDRNDRWWIVRLHAYEGFDAKISVRLQESFAHEQCYSDGTIFRNIRMYHAAKDTEGENRWWARLTESKRKDLRHLLKDSLLTNAFDKLIGFAGLWPPVQLGTLHRLHGLKCTEVGLSLL
jgi:hypothetical protein